jgi:hypothetical protein
MITFQLSPIVIHGSGINSIIMKGGEPLQQSDA